LLYHKLRRLALPQTVRLEAESFGFKARLNTWSSPERREKPTGNCPAGYAFYN